MRIFGVVSQRSKNWTPPTALRSASPRPGSAVGVSELFSSYGQSTCRGREQLRRPPDKRQRWGHPGAWGCQGSGATCVLRIQSPADRPQSYLQGWVGLCLSDLGCSGLRNTDTSRVCLRGPRGGGDADLMAEHRVSRAGAAGRLRCARLWCRRREEDQDLSRSTAPKGCPGPPGPMGPHSPSPHEEVHKDAALGRELRSALVSAPGAVP